MLAFWSGLSPWHLLLVGALALLFYGNRLPEVARSLGKAVNEFKRGLRDVQDEITNEPPRDEPKRLQPPLDDGIKGGEVSQAAKKAEHSEPEESDREE
ncbi:MAG: twin-arginine translocase TatA/TatE family subunit [Phycisphaerae bacterium]|jgi:sec-independent protein translocase protein TatA